MKFQLSICRVWVWFFFFPKTQAWFSICNFFLINPGIAEGILFRFDLKMLLMTPLIFYFIKSRGKHSPFHLSASEISIKKRNKIKQENLHLSSWKPISLCLIATSVVTVEELRSSCSKKKKKKENKRKLILMYRIILGRQRGRGNKYMQRGWQLPLVVNAFHSSEAQCRVRQTETRSRGGEKTPPCHLYLVSLSRQLWANLINGY